MRDTAQQIVAKIEEIVDVFPNYGNGAREIYGFRGVDITVGDMRYWAHLERTMPALESDLHRLHDAAEAYIRNHGHKITCANMLSQQGPCNCGYAELRLALDAALAEAKGERSE